MRIRRPRKSSTGRPYGPQTVTATSGVSDSQGREDERIWGNQITTQAQEDAIQLNEALDESWKDFFEQKRQQRRAVQEQTYRRTF